MFRRSVAAAAAVAFLAAGGSAMAQSKTPPAQAKAPAATQAKMALPTAESLLAKYVEAAGGQAAFDKIQNRVAQGNLDIGQAGIVLALGIYAAKPDKMYTVADSEATGRIESGVVDGVAWENSGMRGAIVKAGAEQADGLRDAAFDRLIYWKNTTKSAECVGTTDIDGKPAYKVVLTPKVGSAQTIYFDKDTALIVQTESTLTMAGQAIDIVSKAEDYRTVDGVKLPFKVRQVVMGQERVLTFDKIQHNVELPADRFALPPAIKAIADKK
jgi:hypothetical protein